MAFNLFDSKAPAAPAKQVTVPSVSKGVVAPKVTAPPVTQKVTPNGINIPGIEDQAMAERVQTYKATEQQKILPGLGEPSMKQRDIATDFTDSLGKGVSLLWKNIMGTAAVVPSAAAKLAQGADVISQRIQGKTSNFTKKDSTRYLERVSQGMNALGSGDLGAVGLPSLTPQHVQLERSVFEMEKLAEIADHAGRPEDAKSLRESGRLTTIQNMTDQEVRDSLDNPAMARKFVRGAGEMLPSLLAAQAAAGELLPSTASSLGFAEKGAVGKAVKLATGSIPMSTVYSILERDQDSPIAKQLQKAGINIATFAALEGGTSLLGSGVKAITPQPIRDAIGNFLGKRSEGIPTTNAEDDQFLGYLREKRVAGEPIMQAEKDIAQAQTNYVPGGGTKEQYLANKLLKNDPGVAQRIAQSSSRWLPEPPQGPVAIRYVHLDELHDTVQKGFLDPTAHGIAAKPGTLGFAVGDDAAREAGLFNPKNGPVWEIQTALGNVKNPSQIPLSTGGIETSSPINIGDLHIKGPGFGPMTADIRNAASSLAADTNIAGSVAPDIVKGAEKALAPKSKATIEPSALSDLRQLSIQRQTKEPFLSRVKGGVQDFISKLYQTFSSRYSPLGTLDKAVTKETGVTAGLRLDRKFEMYAGASAKGEAAAIEAQLKVGDIAKQMPEQWQTYLVGKRTLDRLQTEQVMKAEVGASTEQSVMNKSLATKETTGLFAERDALAKRVEEINLALAKDKAKLSITASRRDVASAVRSGAGTDVNMSKFSRASETAESGINKGNKDLISELHSLEKKQNAVSKKIIEAESKSKTEAEAAAAEFRARFVNQDIMSADGSVRRVVWTVEKAQLALDQLKNEMGDEAWAAMEIAGKRYQQVMDNELQVQLQAGNLSQEQYATIKSKNDFYAPFKILKQVGDDLEAQIGGGEGLGKSMSTSADLTKKVKGVEGDFFIDDVYQESLKQIYRSRMLAEKNITMSKLGDMAGKPGSEGFVKLASGDAKPPPGWEAVRYRVKGKEVVLHVNHDLAVAVKGMNANLTGFLANSLRVASVPLKAGATTFNVGFQTLNVAIRDPLRGYLYFPYGSKNPVTFGLDMVRGFYSSIHGNFGNGGDRMFLDFLKSGGAAGDMSSQLTPGIIEKSRFSVGMEGLNPITNVVKFSRALEQTGKLRGWAAGVKEVNAQFGIKSRFVDYAKKASDSEYKDALEVMAYHVRNYSGSPDFARGGTESPGANLVDMFFTARSQAAEADLRMAMGHSQPKMVIGGKKGMGNTTKAAATIGMATLPVILNAIRNQIFYPDAQKQLTSWERQNYVFIPNGNKFINDAGVEVYDGYRFPKEGLIGGIWDVAERGVDFAFTHDPSNATKAGLDFLQANLPINVDGKNALESGESVLAGLNPAIKVPYEYFTGRDTYRHQNTIDRNYKGVNLKDVHPEEQFTNQTPDWAKLPSEAWSSVTGGHAPEVLSPERLRQAVGGVTGGFTNQIAVPAPLEGRSFLSDFLLTKRFFRTQWVADPAMQESAVNALKDQETFKLKDNREAENTALSISQNPESAADTLRSLAKSNPDLLKKTVSIMEDKAMGLTYTDRLVKQMNVKDGTRAKFIVGQIQSLKPDEANSFLKHMQENGMLSPEVIKQIGAIISAQKK